MAETKKPKPGDAGKKAPARASSPTTASAS